MRVVVYQDFLRVGGTESQSLYLCEQFRERGDDVTLLTNRPGGRLLFLVQEKGVKHKILQKLDFGLDWYAPALIRTLSKLKPELIILMGRNANGRGDRIRGKLPLIQTVSTFRTGRRIPFSYKRSLQSAELILCNSEAAAARLNDLGIECKGIEIHPNACLRAQVITASMLLPISQLKHEFGLSNHCKVLLYVAAFVKGKNHEALLRMMPLIVEKHTEVVLLLAGEGPQESKIREIVERENLEKYVRFMGYSNEVEKLYRVADLAVSPSLEESMPNGIVEAQYAGLPVIAYDEAGVKECLLPGKSGVLVERGNEPIFVSSVIKLLNNEQRLADMSECAREYAGSQFDPMVRFDELYQSVLRLAQKD